MVRRSGSLALVLAVAASGCLSNTHRIPRRDLVAIAQLPPEERGRRVRVIQGFSGEEEPPAAPRVYAHTAIVVTPDPGPTRDPAGGRPASPKVGKAAHGAKDAKDWIILAVAAAVILATTEGARYDGWAELHPMYPVHLYGPGGEHRVVPLAQLDAQTAAWARRAYVREGEGPWRALGRAPLDRVGFTYSVLLGTARIPDRTGADARGFFSHIQLGVFSLQQLGVLFDLGLGWRDNAMGDTVFESRNALELQLLPFSASFLHAGGFGQGGLAVRREDGPGDPYAKRFLYGGGALVQLELTTRLTITGRAGWTIIDDEPHEEFTLGLSVY